MKYRFRFPNRRPHAREAEPCPPSRGKGRIVAVLHTRSGLAAENLEAAVLDGAAAVLAGSQCGAGGWEAVPQRKGAEDQWHGHDGTEDEGEHGAVIHELGLLTL